MKEIFKDIPGYEGKYQVSNLGNILQFKKSNNTWNIKKIGNKGYDIVHLYKTCIAECRLIHRLVAQAFLGLDINDRWTFVCHKDDNPKNNNVDNLFLGTAKDNSQDMVKKGRQGGFKNKGKNNGKNIYTKKDILKVRKLLDSGLRQYQVYNNFKEYNRAFVHRVYYKKTWLDK